MNWIFFDGWESLLRTIAVGVLAYLSLVIFLRITGKRTLSKMNAFDFIVTIALGSTLATVLLSKEVALAQGALAFAVLISMQFVITWLSVRARWVRRLATGEPLLLMHCGEFLAAALRSARVTEDEVRAAIRSSGIGSLSGVRAVVLETDGSFSVVRLEGPADDSALSGVRGLPESGGRAAAASP